MQDLGAEVGDLNLPDLDSCALKHVENKEIDPAVETGEERAESPSDS